MVLGVGGVSPNSLVGGKERMNHQETGSYVLEKGHRMFRGPGCPWALPLPHLV